MKVLVIEDDEGIQLFLKQGFRYKSCVVDQAFDGEEGLQKLINNNYDIALVDLMLPKIDGNAIVKHAQKLHLKTPIVILSALQEISLKTDLLQSGVDHYMSKPFSFEELYARIKAILRRSQRSPLSEEVNHTKVTLIPEEMKVVNNKKEIHLRKKEFLLLRYLIQRSNQVVTRQELMYSVWNYDSMVSSNTIDSHLYNLRKTLEAEFGNSFIKTIHGIGYMYEDSTEA